MSEASAALVHDIVRRAFAPTQGSPLRVTATEWPAVLTALERHRCLGMAAAAQMLGQLGLTPTDQEALDARVEGWLNLSLRVEQVAVAAHRCLVGAGIDYRFLKGVVVAHTLYPDPAWRHFADADVLIPAEQLHDAVAILARDLGAERLLPERRPGWDRRFAKDLPLRIDGVELDLHRTLAPGRAGHQLAPHHLFATRGTVTIGGVALATLDRHWLAEHARLAACRSDRTPRLATLVDADLAAGRTPAPEIVSGSVLRHPWVRDALAVTAVPGRRTAYLQGLLVPSAAYRARRRSSTSS